MRFLVIMMCIFIVCSAALALAETPQHGLNEQIQNLVKNERNRLLIEQKKIFSEKNILFDSWSSLSQAEKNTKYPDIMEKQTRLEALRDSVNDQIKNVEADSIADIFRTYTGSKLALLDKVNARVKLTFYEQIRYLAGYAYAAILGICIGIISFVLFLKKKHTKKANLTIEEIINSARDKADEQARTVVSNAQEEAAEIIANEEKKRDENDKLRTQLMHWHNCLRSANHKLVAMKDLQKSAAGKAIKTLTIMQKKYPQTQKQCRYLQNKIEEMNASYSNAKEAFSTLYRG